MAVWFVVCVCLCMRSLVLLVATNTHTHTHGLHSQYKLVYKYIYLWHDQLSDLCHNGPSLCRLYTCYILKWFPKCSMSIRDAVECLWRSKQRNSTTTNNNNSNHESRESIDEQSQMRFQSPSPHTHDGNVYFFFLRMSPVFGGLYEYLKLLIYKSKNVCIRRRESGGRKQKETKRCKAATTTTIDSKKKQKLTGIITRRLWMFVAITFA